MKTENFEKFVKMFITSVKKIDYFQEYDFYCVVVSGCVSLFELNQLNTICRVSHVSCSDAGSVEVICKVMDDIYIDKEGDL